MTDMEEHLDVENPDDVTGLTKKYNVEISGQKTCWYTKEIDVLALNEDEAEDKAREIFDDDYNHEFDEDEGMIDNDEPDNLGFKVVESK